MRDRMYVEAAEAVGELRRRRDIRRRVEAWWLESGWGLPPAVSGLDAPLALFARQLASARFEDILFYERARACGLLPVWLEYTGDRMSDRSPYKRSLLRRYVCHGRGRNGGLRVQIERLASVQRWAGRRFDEITVEASGQPIVQFHRDLQDSVLQPGSYARCDMTPWLRQMGSRAEAYYQAELSLYLAHGICFEDFHGGESGDELSLFTQRVVEPAWSAVVERFGVLPLIVPMPWWPELAYYPPNANWRDQGVISEESMSSLLPVGR